MKALHFILEILKIYPASFWPTLLLLGMSFWSLSICSLTPIIDVFLYPDGHGRSSMTLKVIGCSRQWAFLQPYLLWNCIVFSGYPDCIIAGSWGISWYYVQNILFPKDLMLGTMQDFFNARWLFFSGSEQGKIYSTLNRELSSVGDGLIAIGTIFSNIVQMVIFLIVPFYISWKVTLLCLDWCDHFVFFIFKPFFLSAWPKKY